MKPFSNRLLNVAVAAIFATAIVTAASSPVLARQANRPAAALKTLNWYAMGPLGGAQWLSTLDPSQITDTGSADLSYMIYGNLVGQLPDGTVIPELAQKISVSKNHKTYTFLLRKNLRFSNGDKLTASDVKWSITRALKKSTNSPVALLYDGHIVGAPAVASGKTNTLSGIRVINATKLTITVDKPIVYFLQTLTYPTADVLDPRIVSGKPPQTFLTNSCVGNVGDGPFKLVCRNSSTDPNHSGFFKPGSTPSITLVPNPRYWGPKPHIKIVQPVYADTQAAFKAFQDGQLDASAVPSASVASERNKKGFLEFPSSIVDYMTPNSQKDSQMHNLHCRLAVSYAINRVAIDKDILHGTQKATYQIIPGNIAGYNKGFITNKSWSPHYNLSKAKAQLKRCPSGLHNLVIPYQHTSVDVDNEYKAVVSMINALGSGVHASLKPMTFDAWLGVVVNNLDKTTIGKVDLTENLWQQDYPDAQDYMTNLLRFGANYDIGGFNNHAYNTLADKAEVTFNKSKRNSLYLEASKIALNDGAWIAIGNAVVPTIINTRVHGLVGAPSIGIVWAKNSDWSKVSIS